MWASDQALWTRAIAVDPACVPCWINRGKAFSDQRRYKDAQAAYLKAITLTGSHPDSMERVGWRVVAYLNLAVAAGMEGQWTQAERFYVLAADQPAPWPAGLPSRAEPIGAWISAHRSRSSD